MKIKSRRSKVDTIFGRSLLFFAALFCLALPGAMLGQTGGGGTRTGGGGSSGGGGVSFPLTSTTANPASTGQLRLANNVDKICWRNAANNADVCIWVDTADLLTVPLGFEPIGIGAAPGSGLGLDVEGGAATGPVTFGGALGLNDCTFSGTPNIFANFVVTIDAAGTPDTFTWAKDFTTQASGVAITGLAQSLSNGVSVTCAATTGHTLNAQWSIQATTGGYVTTKGGVGIGGNASPTADLDVKSTAPNGGKVHLGGATASRCVRLDANLMLVSASSDCTDPTNASNLASGTVAVARGGTGTGSTLTGLVRGSGSAMTGAELSGDATTSGSNVVTIANLPDGVTQAGSLLLTDIAAPSSPAAAHLKTYGDSTDLRFHDKNAAGTIGTTVVADTGATNNFVTGISAAGVISKSQPSCSSLSNAAASCATDATVATNITSGTLPTARLGTTGSGNTFVLSTSPVLTTPSVTTVNDANGNPFIASSATASAVDSLTITNAATANPATVTVAATGADSNIGLTLNPKGTGALKLAQTGSQLVTIGTSGGAGILLAGKAIASPAAGQFSIDGTSLLLNATASGLIDTGATTTIQAPNRTGTTAASFDIALFSGSGTGAGALGQVHLQAPVTTAVSTSTVQPAVDRFTSFNKGGLTSGSGTNIVSVPLAVDTGFGMVINFTVDAHDTTNHHTCMSTGTVTLTGENTAATFVIATPNMSPLGTLTACDGANTITVSFAATSANPSVISVTPTVTGFTASSINIQGSILNTSLQQITLQ